MARRAVVIDMQAAGGSALESLTSALNAREYLTETLCRGTNTATRGNLLSALENLVSETSPGDIAYLHYISESSAFVEDSCESELSDVAEPCGLPVVDGELAQRELLPIISALKPGARLRAVIDFSYNGSALGLPCRWTSEDSFTRESSLTLRSDIIAVSNYLCRESVSGSADLTLAIAETLGQGNCERSWISVLGDLRENLARGSGQTPQLSTATAALAQSPFDL